MSMQRVLVPLRTFFSLALPYFRSEERRSARILLLGVATAEFGVVYTLVAFNEWNAFFFNSIESRNANNFLLSLLLFCGIVAAMMAATMAQFFFGQTLIMRWRRWMTEQYVARWMADGRHYRMQFLGGDVDNAHLRIANDILIFVQRTHELGYNFLGALIALASFGYILWGISQLAPLILFGVNFTFPGYLFWIAILYAGCGTLVAHFIGRPLIGLNFNQQRFESDYRFAIARVWDHGEPVALMRGETVERDVLGSRFFTLVGNWTKLIRRQTWLTGFTGGYTQMSLIFPTVVASPAYFAGTISLGTLMQGALAFQRVDIAFAFFLHSYAKLAEWKASMDRVAQLHGALDRIDASDKAAGEIAVAQRPDQSLEILDLEVRLPSGEPIAVIPRLTLDRGKRALIAGASGSGKSSVVRAISGIWPMGEGRIDLPRGAEVMAMPQQVYFPLGSLKTAIAYPAPADSFDVVAIRAAMMTVKLGHLAHRLDEEADWATALSGGEQQRIAFARAILNRPDVLLLDEAISILDDASGAELYGILAEHLPNTLLISAGRSTALRDLHDETIELPSKAENFDLTREAIKRATSPT